MANGNKGIGSYLPFPTFGGEKSPGIMPVQLQPSAIRFPTSNYNPSRAPADVNPLSAFAPLLLSGIASKLFAEEPMTAPEPEDVDLEKTYSQEDIRKRVDDPERAEYMAEQIFGPRGKLSGAKKWGRLALENLPALFFEDPRELSAYMDTSAAIRKARTDADLSREEFIGDYRANMAAKVLNVTPAYDVETGVARNAIEGPHGGFYIQSIGRDEDVTIGGTAVPKGDYYRNPRWIIGEPARDNTSLIASKRNIDNDFKDERNKLEIVASSLRSSVPMISDIVNLVVESPDITTWWEPLTRFKGQAKAFIDVFNEGKDEKLHLVDNEDNRNTWFNQTTGKATEKFLQGKVMPYFDEVWNAKTQKFDRITKTLDLTALFGDVGNNAEFRSSMINMAYLAAAANGQTGRTLSDKDLALHLQQLGATFGGGGGIRTPQTSIRALTSWFHNQMETTSIKMQELERSSMASDWRRDNPNETTPWADPYISPITEGRDNRTQKLFTLPQVWNNQEDSDWLNYLQMLAAARVKFGPSAVPDNPIKGIDWYKNVLIPYSNALQGDGSTTSENIPIPKEKKKSRSGV
jgi:hypothetical protein